MEALQRAHLPGSDVKGTSLLVSPRWEYDQKTRRQKRDGYQADNTIRIETALLGQLGSFIDAALEAGASDISQVDFSVTDADSARRQALAQAVTNARSDAEAIANAGGGTLGRLLQLSTEGTNTPLGAVFREVAVSAPNRAADATTTQVMPPQIKITGNVVAIWEFVAH